MHRSIFLWKMESIPTDRSKANPSVGSPDIDQILVVGMKYGPTGTQEAVKRVRQLTPELVPAQVWHRMRHLREKERGKGATPIDWSESAIEILREGYRSGGRKKTEAIKTVRALYPGLAGYVVSRFARSQGWLDKERADNQKEIDDLGQGKKNKNYLRAPVMNLSKPSPKSSTLRTISSIPA